VLNAEKITLTGISLLLRCDNPKNVTKHFHDAASACDIKRIEQLYGNGKILTLTKLIMMEILLYILPQNQPAKPRFFKREKPSTFLKNSASI
jgi:hypothetical protein